MSKENYADVYPETTLENLNTTLETHGVAVLPSVFSHQECSDVKAKVLAYLANSYNVTQADDFKKLKVSVFFTIMVCLFSKKYWILKRTRGQLDHLRIYGKKKS